MSLLFYSLFLFASIKCFVAQDVIVTVPLGRIRGTILQSRGGRDYYSFRGIRYAEPPVGELRWKPPLPVTTEWNDDMDATIDGPVCYQMMFEFPADLMSEDCLRINVYSTHLVIKDESSLRPVLVFIHGGGFHMGSGNSYAHDPLYMMDHDIIVVTFNYRLGVMGFLSTGTVDMPGNDGFKDQVMALKWIKENIKFFGGDPERVTISGQSAGAMSTTAHLASPMSQGLFHQIIAMSGSSVAQWDVPEHQMNLVEKLASTFNCLNDSIEEMITCLRKLPASKIATSVEHFNEFGIYPTLIFKPVIEPDFGQERFLTQSPEQAILSNNFANVPILTGIVSDEFSWLAVIALAIDELRYELNNNFKTVAPITFLYERETERSENISRILEETFLPTSLVFYESLQELQVLFGDGIIAYGVHRLVQLLWDKVDVFYYKTSFIGRFSVFQDIGIGWEGVDHEDDLQYIFHVQRIGPVIKFTDPENIAVERITRLWVNFVEKGNPNDVTDPYIGNINWTPYDGIDSRTYLEIGDELSISEDLLEERFSVWDSLFPFDDVKKSKT